jgi:thymine-DNA glycosylase
MRLSIPRLLDKIQTHKPKVCCFVGKKIWDVFEGVIKKSAGKEKKEWVDLELEVEKDGDVESVQAKVEYWDKSELVSVSTSTSSVDTPVPIPMQPTTTTTTMTTTTTISEKPTPLRVTKTSPKFSWDQPRPFILFHNDAPSGNVVKIENVGYTLFWVVPSTSGLERTPVSLIYKKLRGETIDSTSSSRQTFEEETHNAD